jgi:hypothetical protein
MLVGVCEHLLAECEHPLVKIAPARKRFALAFLAPAAIATRSFR